jgi:hypothetical protein
VRFERLVIEAGENSFAVDLHPNLTVIGGVGRLERDGLINEFVGALGAGRPGVHLELRADNNTRFAVFRPYGAAHRIVDIDAATDVTAAFADQYGNVDLLSRAGCTSREAKQAMRITAADLMTSTERDALVQRLSQVNQNELWVAAEALRSSQRRLEEEAEAVGTNAEDAEVIQRIEATHAQFEERQARFEQVRSATYLAAGFSAIGVVPAMALWGLVAALPLIALAVISVVVSFMSWRGAVAARCAEDDALAQAGAQSYLGFHLQRVNGLLTSDQARRRLMRASEEHREAQRRWNVIAGNVDVDWAISNRGDISSAVQLRNDVIAGTGARGSGNDERDQVANLAHTIVSRLAVLRKFGVGSESFPALLDEPFSGLDSHVSPALLELLVRSSAHQQIIVFTNNDAICEWARVERMTGAVSLIEPTANTPIVTPELDAPQVIQL